MGDVEALAPLRYIVCTVYSYEQCEPGGLHYASEKIYRIQCHARETKSTTPALQLFIPEDESFLVLSRLVQRYGTSNIRLGVLYVEDDGSEKDSGPVWRLGQYQKVKWK